MGTLAGGASRLSTVALGTGAVGVGLGYEAIKSAAHRKKFLVMTQTPSPISDAQMKRMERDTFRMARRSNANLQDLYVAPLRPWERSSASRSKRLTTVEMSSAIAMLHT